MQSRPMGPTGAAMERASTANGDYMRFADGTQICTQAALTVLPDHPLRGMLSDLAAYVVARIN